MVNTGDSLIALSVNIEDNHGGFGFGLYSPRVTRSVSNLSTASSSPSDDQMSCDCDLLERPAAGSTPLEEVENTSETVLLGSSVLAAQSPCSNSVTPTVMVGVGPHVPNVPKDGIAQGENMRLFTVRERPPTLPGKENQLSSPVQTPLEAPTARHETPNSKLHRAWDVYNFEGSTPKKDELDTSEYYEVVHESPSSSQPGGTKVRATLAFAGYQQSASMGASTEEISLFQGDSMDSQSLDDELDRPSVFQKPAEVSSIRLPSRDPSTSSSGVGAGGISPRGLSGLTLIPPENFTLTKGLCVSPGCGKLEQAAGSSTCSSCVSSPIILQSDSQCFTYSVRRYVECYGRPESPVDMEGGCTGQSESCEFIIKT